MYCGVVIVTDFYKNGFFDHFYKLYIYKLGTLDMFVKTKTNTRINYKKQIKAYIIAS